jgi:hypothetical protein
MTTSLQLVDLTGLNLHNAVKKSSEMRLKGQKNRKNFAKIPNDHIFSASQLDNKIWG